MYDYAGSILDSIPLLSQQNPHTMTTDPLFHILFSTTTETMLEHHTQHTHTHTHTYTQTHTHTHSHTHTHNIFEGGTLSSSNKTPTKHCCSFQGTPATLRGMPYSSVLTGQHFSALFPMTAHFQAPNSFSYTVYTEVGLH